MDVSIMVQESFVQFAGKEYKQRLNHTILAIINCLRIFKGEAGHLLLM